MKKVAVITGSSSGLGLNTAILLTKKGYTVYATLRNLNKKDHLVHEAQKENVQLHIEALDVTKPDTIKDCIENIISKENKIDILINNAGTGFLRASEQTTDEELYNITDVNYFGVVRCTNAVLPFMRKQKSGHIINISSVGGLVGQPFNEIYCAAKFAIEGYTEALATYINPFFGIKFTIVEPGGISTEFANTVYKNFQQAGKTENDPYATILEKYITTMQSRSQSEMNQIYQTGEQVAEAILHCLENPNPPLRIRTSQWANEFCEFKTSGDPDGLKLFNKLKKDYFES